MVSELAAATKRIQARITSVRHGALGCARSGSQVDQPESNNLLFFGRMERYKGLDVFIGAMQWLDTWKMDYTATVAGRGPAVDRFRRRLVANSRVVLRDSFIPADELPDLFEGAALVVLPYLDGTQSGVAAMAVGFGRPVVATQVGALPELVVPGVTGTLVPPGDPLILAQSLAHLLSSPVKVAEMASSAETFAREVLSWDTIARDTEVAYQSLRSSTIEGAA